MNITIFSDNLSTVSPSRPSLNKTQTARNQENSFSSYHCGLSAFSVLVLISNLFAVLFYLTHKKIRRNVSNVLLLSLAISDLLVGLIFLPLVVVCERLYSQVVTNATLTNMCRFNYMMGNLCGFSTIFHIIALTIEEYIAVLHPFKKISLSTRTMYTKILILVWFLASFFSIIPVFWMSKDLGSPSWHENYRRYGILQLVVFFGISVVALTFCYCRMFVKISAKLSECLDIGRMPVRVRNARKTFLVFLLFFTVFVVGWCPWFIFTLNQRYSTIHEDVKNVLITMRFAGAFLNPLIYTFLKGDYQRAITTDLARLCSRFPKPLQCIDPTSHQTRSRSNTAENRGL